MAKFRRVSLADQTAGYLRSDIATGVRRYRLPGVRKLSEELHVSPRTLLSALRLLVAEGLISSAGARSPYLIHETKARGAPETKSLRVALLIRGAPESHDKGIQAVLLRIIARLRLDGHDAFIVSTPSDKDPHKIGYLRKLVGDAKADAWLVHHAPFETVRWFSTQKTPFLVLGGRTSDFDVASASFPVEPALRALVRRLLRLGHRRIVLIATDLSRRPDFSPLLCAYREELAAQGVTPGEYNHPDWVETPGGLRKLLDSLFALTPPTAILAWHPGVVTGALAFFAARGLSIPGDVSFFGFSDDPNNVWQMPGMRLAHFDFDEDSRLRHVRDWVEGVATGKPSSKSYTTPTGLIEGNTLGPVKR